MIKVLFIEDEEALGKITTDILHKNGFTVDWATDGKSGLNLFNEKKYDVCIADIMLPGIDGYTLVTKIREANTDMPVIFLSARSLTEDIVKGFTIGGNDYLKKPFSVEELIVRLHALVNRRQNIRANTPSIFNVGKYKYNHKLMELSYGDTKILLTHLENELLFRLVQNLNGVVERDKVLMELWGSDTFFNARSMDVFISKLRKYLGADDHIAIINIRRIGYKLMVRES